MTAFNAQGCLLKRGDGTTPTEAFATVGEIKSFDGPSGSVTVIDVTTLADIFKQKMGGTVDEGQFSFTVHFDPADTQQTGLRTDRKNRTLRNFELVLNDDDDTVISFSALVLDFPISGSVDAAVEGSITLEVSGEVEFS